MAIGTGSEPPVPNFVPTAPPAPASSFVPPATAAAFDALCVAYGVRLVTVLAASSGVPMRMRVEIAGGGGGGLGMINDVQALTVEELERKLKSWGLRPRPSPLDGPVALGPLPSNVQRLPSYAGPTKSGVEQMREQAAESRAARAEAAVPVGVTINERQVVALERIAFALERLADR